jgi:hypothetical protein
VVGKSGVREEVSNRCKFGSGQHINGIFKSCVLLCPDKDRALEYIEE